ncbi:MAG: hypothetical protein K5640_00620 [Treponema sp.]|nr:hypothetical protein [Treponema sp.]
MHNDKVFLNMLKKICVFTLFFHILISFSLTAETATESASLTGISTETGFAKAGHEISDEVQKILITSGFSPTKTNIISPSAGDFSYNLSLDFYPENFSSIENLEDFKTKLIIVLKQTDFLTNSKQILDFVSEVLNGQSVIPFSILFVPPESETLNSHALISGTKMFIDDIFVPDNIFAVCINFISDEISQIMPGNGKEVSPLWLVKQLANAFKACAEEYTVPAGTFLTLYRYNLIQNDRNEAVFLENEIPAVSVNISKTAGLDKIFSTFLTSYDYTKSSEWDRHYFFWKIPWNNINIILKEDILIKLYLAVALVTIFTLCTFSIIADEKLRKATKEIFHLAYLLPALVFFIFISLSAGGKIATPLAYSFHISPIFQLYLKVQITFIVISLILLVYIRFTKVHTPYAYTFYLNLSAIINIFIFSSIDLSFFFLFVLEYILISMLKADKKPAFFSIIAILLFIPFIPYGITLWKLIKPEQISFLLAGNRLQTVFLALAIQSFNLIWLFILSHCIKLKERQNFFLIIKKAFPLIIYGSICLSGCFILIFYVLKNYRNIPSVADIEGSIVYKNTTENNIELLLADKSSYGNTVRELTINSSKIAERYEIKIEGKTKQPVYEATVPYFEESTKNKTAVYFPDFPPEQCAFTYTTTSNEDENITVSAYFPTKDKNVFEIETKTISIAAHNSDSSGTSTVTINSKVSGKKGENL